MRSRPHDLWKLLTSPVNGGRTRWGNHPHARMSLLSVLSFAGAIAALIGLGAVDHFVTKVPNTLAAVAVFASIAMVFLSGWLDARRDRRLGLLPRRRR